MSLVPAGELDAMRDVLDQQANCALTQIAQPGALDEWSRPTGQPTVIWAGEALAIIGRSLTLKRTLPREGESVGELQAQATQDVLTILDGHALTDLIVAGPDDQASLLTIEDRRTTPPVTLTFRASRTRHEAAGLLDYLEIGLRDPAA